MCLSRADHRFFHCGSMMSLWQTIILFVVCGLIECNDSVCDVTCTTDFISTLNCSNSDLTGTASCFIVAKCSDEYGTVEGRCSITSSQSWCTIDPEDLQIMMDYDTNCSITTTTQMTKQGAAETPTTKYMSLYRSIKLIQPFNLSVAKIDEGFNLTWDVAYTSHELYDKLYYRVRLRIKDDPSEKEEIFTQDQNQQSIVFLSERLLPGRQYVADIQVAVHPRSIISEWSEWSNSAEWTCDPTGSEQYYLLLLMAVPIAAMAVVLLYSGKLGGIKKMLLWQHIPSPHDYFTPLYHTHQGDFKKWVGPVLTFSSFDVLEKNSIVQVLCDKQQPERSEEPGNNRNAQHRDSSPNSPANQNSSKFYFHGSGSQVVTHSGGHISMDTVTVSGQEGIVADWSSESHRRSIEDFPNSEEADRRAHEIADGQLRDLLPNRRGSLQDCDDWHVQDHIERVSLVSYSSNEHSDDGYPQMGLDLDTIDSGFLESDCSSPSAFDEKEQIETASLDGVGVFHSNYVKQWVSFTAVQVDTHSSG